MIFPRRTEERKVRVFSLSPTFIDQFVGKQPKWGPVGYLTYKRTYARVKEDNTTEEFWETCKRVVEGVYNIQKIHCRTYLLPWNEQKAQLSAQEMYQRMWDFKWTPPGRGLWAMGTDMIHLKGSACLNNCAFVSTQDIDTDFSAPFTFLMDMSMLGVGVGGDTKGAGKVKLQRPKVSDKPYVVEDSREGWVDLVKTVLNSFVGKGYYPKEIDYSQVRPKGTPIVGFGGIASGYEPLKEMIDSISKILMPTEEYSKITSGQIVDVFNYIGKCVVAGGVRRTAEIMFGEMEDDEFMTLKQDKDALYDRRWASNNSIYGKVGMDYTRVAELLSTNGEPGIVWLDNMREYSRMADPKTYKDMRAMGSNPCSEQTLESFELCCLVETFPAHHDDLEDYKQTLKYAYLYAKTVTLVPTHDMRTNAVMQRNRRIGCSQSGIIQAINKLGRREYLNWCDSGYTHIQDLDHQYSEWLCIPKSVKTTSVKPSGTVSLLCGATPGIHYPHSEYYIRNIRLPSTSPLIQACQNANYKLEQDAYDKSSMVVSIPIQEENFQKCKDDVSIWEQFANASDLQKHWADNQVSITVTFTKDEKKDIKGCLEHFETTLKSVSLLPLADSDHQYVQAPYIKITKAEYDEMTKGLLPLDLSDKNTHDVNAEDKFCDGDSCTI
jgi:ribonucleoside-triphosphate reductase